MRFQPNSFVMTPLRRPFLAFFNGFFSSLDGRLSSCKFEGWRCWTYGGPGIYAGGGSPPAKLATSSFLAGYDCRIKWYCQKVKWSTGPENNFRINLPSQEAGALEVERVASILMDHFDSRRAQSRVGRMAKDPVSIENRNKYYSTKSRRYA